MTGTQSVLDQMAAGIMGRKQEKAATLTPVGLEAPAKPAIAEVKGDIFPHDGGIQSQIIFSAKIIRENLFQMRSQLDGMEDCLQSIEREVGLRDALPALSAKPVEAPLVEAPLVEESFEEKYAAQQADAQAQAFGSANDAPVVPPVSTSGNLSSGWECPTHGSDSLTTLTSRKGRKYRSCIGCDQFERIA